MSRKNNYLTILMLIIGTFVYGYPDNSQAALPDDFALPYVTVDQTLTSESYPILKPLKDGPIRILYIGDSRPVAQVCSAVAARLDCEYACVLTRSHTELGLPDDIDKMAPEPLRRSSVFRRLDRELGQAWDVIWLDYDLDNMPGGLGDMILEMVENGTGLVMAGSRDRARHLSTGRGSDENLTGAIRYRTIDNIEVRRRGDGIIVNIPESPQMDEDIARGDFFNSAAQGLLFAAGRSLSMIVRGFQLSSKPVEHETIRIMRYRVNIYNTGESDSVAVTARYRDESDQVIETYTNTFFIAEDNNILSIPYPQVLVGVYSIDITGETKQGVVFSGGTSFSVDSVDRIDKVNLWYPFAPRDDFVLGTVFTTSPLKRGMYVTINIKDIDGRLLDTKTLDIVPSRKSIDFIMSLYEHYPRAIEVAATFYKNNVPVETVVRPFFIAGDNADRLRFGAINSLGTTLSSDEYRALADAGFDLYAATVSSSIRPEDVYDEYVYSGKAGLQAVPDLSSYIGEDERTFHAALDTLRALDPYAFIVGDTEQIIQIQHVAPEMRVARMPTDNDVERDIILESPYVITYGDNKSTGVLQEITTNTIESGERITNAVLVPDRWKYSKDRRLIAAIPWWALFKGYQHLWWGEVTGDAGSALSPWGTISPLCNVVAEEIRNSTYGIQDILYNAAIPVDGTDLPRIHITNAAGDIIPEDTMVTRIWQDGEISYIGIALIPGTGYDSITETLSIHIDQSVIQVYVYEMIDGRYLGAVDEFETKLEHGACLIACMSYRVRSLDITPVQSVILPDAPIEFSVQINTADNQIPGRHTLQIALMEVEKPDIVVANKIVVTDKGLCRTTLHIPEHISGQAILSVTDISSGLSDQHQIIISKKDK